jgi:sortase (surface protein transpeptidase)
VVGKTLTACVLGLSVLAGCAAVPPATARQIHAEAPPATTTPAAALEQLAPAQPGRLVIPDLEVDRPLVSLGITPEGDHEVPTGAADVGWYRGGPTPGEVGPAIILGHVNWAGQEGSFAHLSRLLPGDLIAVGPLTFAVYDVRQVPKDRFPVELVYGPTPDAQLRLITCGGAFVGENYLDNVIVSARWVPDAPAWQLDAG